MADLLTIEKKQRHTGIELFRCFSMILIVILHILGQGGVLAHSNSILTKPQYYTAWLLETIGYCSVNCYALISGYVNKDETLKLSKLFKLWLEVVFWLVLPITIYSIFVGEVDAVHWQEAFAPVTNKAYWYFNAYFLLFPLIPILNRGLKTMTKKQYQITLLFLFISTACLHCFVGYDTFATSSGYSCMWLVIMYVFGAYFRLHGIPKFAKWYITVPTFFLCGGLAWMIQIHAYDLKFAGIIGTDSFYYDVLGRFVEYTSPFMVIMSLCALCFFAKLDIKNRVASAIIGLFGKSSFGVYLIHVGPFVWATYMKYAFKHIADYAPWRIAVEVIVTAILFFIALDILSIVRSLIFRFTGINKLIDWVAGVLGSVLKDKNEKQISE